MDINHTHSDDEQKLFIQAFAGKIKFQNLFDVMIVECIGDLILFAFVFGFCLNYSAD